MVLPDQFRPFRFTVEDYVRLDRDGAFNGVKVELIEGVVIAVPSEMMPHTRMKNDLMFRLRLALHELGSDLTALVEPSVRIGSHNMPDPDVFVGQLSSDRKYAQIEDVALLIEVGASSLRGDLGVKRQMYAAHALPEYWVVDVAAKRVHQFWSPIDGEFQERCDVPLDGPLTSATMPDLTIDGSGIL